jgi:hypothetical protein
MVIFKHGTPPKLPLSRDGGMAYVWMDGGQVKFRYYVRTVVEASVGISEPQVTSPWSHSQQ